MPAIDQAISAEATTGFPPTPCAWHFWYLGWKPGPVDPDPDHSVFVSLTEFHIHHHRHAAGAWRAGVRLRRSWPRVDGAIGLWLWSEPFKLRSGSVSIWRSEQDLSQFVRSRVHRAIVREYHSRMSGTSRCWTAPRFNRPAIWRRAVSELRAGQTDEVIERTSADT